MKKNDQDTTLLNDDITSDKKNLKTDKFKTTNVNILLNRVRLDEKKIFRKKLILFLIFLYFISLFTIYNSI